MNEVVIQVGPLRFTARFEDERAPATFAAFRAQLPFEGLLARG